MDTYLSLSNPTGILIASSCCIFLGLLLLLAERSLRGPLGTTLGLLFLVLLLSGAATAAFLNQPKSLWLPVVGVACCWGIGLLLRTAGTALVIRCMAQLLAHHRIQSLALIVLGFSSILAWCSWGGHQVSELDNESEVWGWKAPALCKKAPFQFVTDRGRPVGTYVPKNSSNAALSIESEDRYLQQYNMTGRVIRTAKPDISSNCHGWVFTAGRFWISCDEIDMILHDNGYVEVSAPQLNDLVVCRGVEGSALHTAVVRMVKEDGSVIVESKWGKKGTFLHAPDDQLYADDIHYYRTSRGSHLLLGPDGKPYVPGEARPAYAEGRTAGQPPDF